MPWWHVHRRVYDWTLAWAYRPSAAVALFVLAFAESSFFPVPPDVLLMPLTLGNRKRWLRYATICSVASITGAVFGFCIGWLLWESPFFVLATILGALIAGPIGWCVSYRKSKGFGAAIATCGMAFAGATILGCLGWVAWTGTVAEFFFHIVPGFNQQVFDRVSDLYDKYNFWIVFTAGFTPIPFKVITITAGLFGTGPRVPSQGMFFAVFLVAAAVSRSARFFLVAGLMRVFGPKITPFIEKYFNWLALAFVVLLIGGFMVFKYVL